MSTFSPQTPTPLLAMAPIDYTEMTRALKRCERYLGCRSSVNTTKSEKERIFEKSVVFIAIDLEADDSKPQRITELGVSVLDTNAIQDVRPGNNVENWMRFVKSSHWRILNQEQELGQWNSKNRYVKDKPDAFGLGVTQEKTMEEMKPIIRKQFEEPFLKGVEVEERSTKHTKRKLVFVAHSLKSDLDFLSQLDFDPRKQ